MHRDSGSVGDGMLVCASREFKPCLISMVSALAVAGAVTAILGVESGDMIGYTVILPVGIACMLPLTIVTACIVRSRNVS